MPTANLTRISWYQEVTIANGTATSGWIDARAAAGGAIRVPSAWTAADITFQVQERGIRDGFPVDVDALPKTPTPAKLRDKAGVLVKISGIQVAEAGWYAIPAEVLQAGWFRLRSTNTGSEADVNQGAARVLLVALKS